MDELSNVASQLKVETDERNKNKLFMSLRAGMGSVINKIRSEFSKKNLSRIDFDAVADLVLYQSLDSFDAGKGRITYHAYRFIREYVKREIIKASHIKVPILVAKNNYKVTEEDRPKFMHDGNKDFLQKKYALTDSMYESLLRVHRNVGKRYLTSLDSIPAEPSIDDDSILVDCLSLLEPKHEKLMRMHYGFDGQVRSLEACANTFKMTLEEVEEMHGNCLHHLKEIMRGMTR